ncbi:nuclear transport factor 2 family protein [Flavobacterium hauense]
MKKLYLFLSVASIVATTAFFTTETAVNTTDETKAITTLLNDWHVAAAKGDYNGYFGKIAEDGIYIGTDATENWNKKAFEAFSKPYFDKGKAWDFKPLERHIYFSKDGKTAWFDELLDTWMKVCQGSGVLEKQGKEWKIKHYVLSMTVPNDAADAVIPIKAKYEDALIEKLKAKK